MKRLSLSLCTVLLASVSNIFAWDYEGHRLVNEIALTSLPTNFPAFALTPAAQERVAFLAGEADRWRNSNNQGFQHLNELDHYFDIEGLAPAGLTPQTVSHFRYEFAGQMYVARAQHPEKFPALDPKKNEAHVHELIGLLPWAIQENYAKLKSSFSYLKTFEAHGGTPEEIANAKQNIIYVMGVMGHYCGDAGQPLHTTVHHHGWVGENPKHYATNSSIHRWIDGGYIGSSGIGLKEMKGRIRPAKTFPGVEAKDEDIFPGVMDFVMAQNKMVEPLYKLNQDGSLSDHGEGVSKGRAFVTGQLIVAGQLLGDLWYSAWDSAQEDSFLKTQLSKRTSPPKPRTTKKR
ncbi:MAG: hypothetical protein JWM68_3383 [Verrucomicrobiales bacterium]|nr:hypothetical protein [Verrucomicrobiales bacterium]